MKLKKCKHCEIDKPLSRFGVRKNHGKDYIVARCKDCINFIDRAKLANGEKTINKLVHSRSPEYQRQRMHKPEYKAIQILGGSRKYDKSKGYDNDLNHEFIRQTIAKPCVYCGSGPDHVMMTLDRVDNTKGHLQDNCVSCCYRCNLTKSDMPHAAWLLIAEAVKKANELGLFGEWRTKYTRKAGPPTEN